MQRLRWNPQNTIRTNKQIQQGRHIQNQHPQTNWAFICCKNEINKIIPFTTISKRIKCLEISNKRSARFMHGKLSNMAERVWNMNKWKHIPGLQIRKHHVVEVAILSKLF